LTFTRRDTSEFDRETVEEDFALIRKAQEEARQHLDSINNRLKHYYIVLQPKPKRKKRVKFEEEV
jgi:hypothetical protein